MTTVNTALERVGHGIGDAMEDMIFRAMPDGPRWSAKPEPQSSVRLGPSGDHRLSQGEEK